jgi:hypothetical protein
MVSYTCDQRHDQVVIDFIGAYNEEGEAMLKNMGPNTWDPWKLVSFDKSGDHIVKIKTIKRSCSLSDGQYSIEIGPSPGNTNVQGECGANMGAWAKVIRGTKELVYKEMGACRMNEEVVKRIVVRAGNDKPSITIVKWEDFYK